MINFFIIQNLSGKNLFSRWYNSDNIEKRRRLQEMIREKLSTLEENSLSYFSLEDNRIIFKKYSSVFLIAGTDFEENILLILTTLQLINEAFGSHSREINDIDVIYNNKNFIKMMDDIIVGGEIIGTSLKRIKNGIRHQ